MTRIWTPYAFDVLGNPLPQVAPPALRVLGDGVVSEEQAEMIQSAFYKFCDQAHTSFVTNPNQQGYLADGSPFRIIDVAGTRTMLVWPVGGESTVVCPPGIIFPEEITLEPGSIPKGLVLTPPAIKGGEWGISWWGVHNLVPRRTIPFIPTLTANIDYFGKMSIYGGLVSFVKTIYGEFIGADKNGFLILAAPDGLYRSKKNDFARLFSPGEPLSSVAREVAVEFEDEPFTTLGDSRPVVFPGGGGGQFVYGGDLFGRAYRPYGEENITVLAQSPDTWHDMGYLIDKPTYWGSCQPWPRAIANPDGTFAVFGGHKSYDRWPFSSFDELSRSEGRNVINRVSVGDGSDGVEVEDLAAPGVYGVLGATEARPSSPKLHKGLADMHIEFSGEAGPAANVSLGYSRATGQGSRSGVELLSSEHILALEGCLKKEYLETFNSHYSYSGSGFVISAESPILHYAEGGGRLTMRRTRNIRVHIPNFGYLVLEDSQVDEDAYKWGDGYATNSPTILDDPSYDPKTTFDSEFSWRRTLRNVLLYDELVGVLVYSEVSYSHSDAASFYTIGSRITRNSSLTPPGLGRTTIRVVSLNGGIRSKDFMVPLPTDPMELVEVRAMQLPTLSSRPIFGAIDYPCLVGGIGEVLYGPVAGEHTVSIGTYKPLLPFMGSKILAGARSEKWYAGLNGVGGFSESGPYTGEQGNIRYVRSSCLNGAILTIHAYTENEIHVAISKYADEKIQLLGQILPEEYINSVVIDSSRPF